MSEFRSADNTLFPSLATGAPGDNPEHGQSLEENPVLPPLVPRAENFPEAQDVAVAQAEPAYAAQGETVDSGVKAVPSGGEEAVPPGNQTATARKRSAEARIAQLTARYRATQSQNDALLQEIAALRQSIAQLQAASAQPPSQRPFGNGSPQPPVFAPSADSDGAPSGSRGVDLRAVEEVVARYVQPLASRIQQNDAALQQRETQLQSWNAAVADYPELAQAGSDENRLFNELWRSHPLRHLPDGPEQIAVMVKGILADARREQNVAAARKTSAAVHIPMASPTDVLPTAQAEQIGKLIEDSALKLKRGDNSFDTYKALRLASAARQRQLVQQRTT